MMHVESSGIKTPGSYSQGMKGDTLLHFPGPPTPPFDNVPNTLLKSRKPIWNDPHLYQEDYDILEEWRKIWRLSVGDHNVVFDPTKPLNGFNLPKQEWSKLI
ncbi:hypothetical protein Trydic_g9534 [Trypoxylus dichotomus]